MVYGILVLVETDEASQEAPSIQMVADEVQSDLESTDWYRFKDITRIEVKPMHSMEQEIDLWKK